MWVTLAGTIAIYGIDHWAERGFQTHLSNRHQSHWIFDLFIVFFVIVSAIFGLLQWRTFGFTWLLILGISGGAYLLTTWAKWIYIPGFKETLGAWCFTYLIWGTLSRHLDGVQLAFFSMGLTNFFHSSYQDKARDHANALPSIAFNHPKMVKVMSKSFALVSVSLFIWSTGLSPFTLCALAHLLWPFEIKTSIDWALTPMLISLALNVA